jgi:hypothetical protein
MLMNTQRPFGVIDEEFHVDPRFYKDDAYFEDLLEKSGLSPEEQVKERAARNAISAIGKMTVDEMLQTAKNI